jgi:hypothetical protein
MRKITAGLFVSLDGVAEAPDGWHLPFLTEEWQRLIGARLPQADAILLGRRTFVEFTRVWPPQGTDTPMAAFMNTTRKYVVSWVGRTWRSWRVIRPTLWRWAGGMT